MSGEENGARSSFVLLQIGARRFALPSSSVAELAPPVRLHTFPHASPLVTGVIVRRGRIVPVYDASAELYCGGTSAHRFYLIVRRPLQGPAEFAALPVDGECELVSGGVRASEGDAPRYVSGSLDAGNESISILDFEALVASFAANRRNEAEPRQ